MNKPPIRLAWTDFVLDLQDLLILKRVMTPMYIVGGAVRDAYRRAEIKDIDITVDGDAIQLARKIANWLEGDIFVMDVERGVARVFVSILDDSVTLDFASFRGATLADDLRDRDFTINAMASDMLGDITVLIDPLDGADDLNQKILRRCSDKSIVEDPIRIIRAIRQSVELQLKIHPDTLGDIRNYVNRINESSPERVRDEFYKILSLPNPSRAMRILQHLEILKFIINDIDALVGLKQELPHRFDCWNHTLLVVKNMSSILTSISYQRTDNTAATFDLGMLVIQLDRYRHKLQAHISREYGNGRTHRELLILGALIHNLGKAEESINHSHLSKIKAKQVAESLRLANDEQKALVTMVGSYRDVLDQLEWTVLDLHRFWFSLGEGGIDAILLVVADYLGTYGAELEQISWLVIVERVTILLDAYFNKYEKVVNPILFLDGNEIMNMLNLQSSPVIGKLLMKLREAQVVGDVTSVETAQAFIEEEFQL